MHKYAREKVDSVRKRLNCVVDLLKKVMDETAEISRDLLSLESAANVSEAADEDFALDDYMKKLGHEDRWNALAESTKHVLRESHRAGTARLK